LHGTGLRNIHAIAVDRGRIFWVDPTGFKVEICDTEMNAHGPCTPFDYEVDIPIDNWRKTAENIIIYGGKQEMTKEVGRIIFRGPMVKILYYRACEIVKHSGII